MHSQGTTGGVGVKFHAYLSSVKPATARIADTLA